jgi:hypothetical protein
MSYRAAGTTRLNTPSNPRCFEPALAFPPFLHPEDLPNGVARAARLVRNRRRKLAAGPSFGAQSASTKPVKLLGENTDKKVGLLQSGRCINSEEMVMTKEELSLKDEMQFRLSLLRLMSIPGHETNSPAESQESRQLETYCQLVKRTA